MRCPKESAIDRTDNIEATFDPKTGIKVVFQNADSTCDNIAIPGDLR